MENALTVEATAASSGMPAEDSILDALGQVGAAVAPMLQELNRAGFERALRDEYISIASSMYLERIDEVGVLGVRLDADEQREIARACLNAAHVFIEEANSFLHEKYCDHEDPESGQ